MSLDLEQKLKDLKVRIYDGAEALEAAIKEKELIVEVLVKIAKSVGVDTTQQMTYDQIVDAVQAVVDKLDTAQKAAVAAPATDVAETAAPVTAETPTVAAPVQ